MKARKYFQTNPEDNWLQFRDYSIFIDMILKNNYSVLRLLPLIIQI